MRLPWPRMVLIGAAVCACDPGPAERQQRLRARYPLGAAGAGSIAALQAAVDRGRASADDRCDLAAALAAGGRLGPALEVLEEARGFHPEEVRVLYNLGDMQRRLGRLGEAVETLTGAVRREPGFADLRLSLCGAYAHRAPVAAAGSPERVVQADLDSALAHCAAAVGQWPENPLYRHNLGRVLYLAARYGEAAEAFGEALSLDTGRQDTRLYLGKSLVVAGRFEPALEHLSGAVAAEPKDAEGHYFRGRAFEGLGRLPEAVRAYERAVALRPKYADALYSLGRVLHRDGRREEGDSVLVRFESLEARGEVGLAAARAAVQRQPRDPGSRRALAARLIDDGRLSEAREQLLVAGALDPRHAGVLYDLGLVLARQKDWAGSIGALAEAVRIEPDSAAYGVRLAQAYAGAGMTAEAARTLGRILEIRPAHGKARLEMARIEETRGRLGEAEKLLKDLLRVPAKGVDPETVRFQLAVILLRTERPDEARRLLERVVEGDPTFPRAAELLRAIERRQREAAGS
ncbi:MAG: tetratricopeptide repeat protein [Gemmatimonadaceae bacterium]|nr:tetratricopeptide repeat protein [Gemmatimonadaceae bacterium]